MYLFINFVQFATFLQDQLYLNPVNIMEYALGATRGLLRKSAQYVKNPYRVLLEL